MNVIKYIYLKTYVIDLTNYEEKIDKNLKLQRKKTKLYSVIYDTNF